MLKQLLIKTDKKCLYKFVYNMGIKGIRGIRRFKKRLKKGVFFPDIPEIFTGSLPTNPSSAGPSNR